jgi:ribonuclease Z
MKARPSQSSLGPDSQRHWRLAALVASLMLTSCAPIYSEATLLDGAGVPIHACPAEAGVQSQQIERGRVESLRVAADLRTQLLDPQRISVVTCGTGSPVPTERAQSCTAVFVGGKFFLFDVGDRAQPSIEALNLPDSSLSAVFITHFHSDHIADLGEAISRSWIRGRVTPLTVYGPEGIEPIVAGFLQVYASDVVYRSAHHGPTVFPQSSIQASAQTVAHSVAGEIVYQQDEVTVKAFTVSHHPADPSVGYRVEHRGRVVAISGDTTDGAGLRAVAANADVLVSEVLDHGYNRDSACGLDRAGDARTAAIFRDIRDYHLGAETLGRVAAETGVKTLMLTHQVPSISESDAAERFPPLIKNGGFTGKLVVSKDGTTEVLQLK